MPPAGALIMQAFRNGAASFSVPRSGRNFEKSQDALTRFVGDAPSLSAVSVNESALPKIDPMHARFAVSQE
jgi:hypothetical protein